MTEEIKEVDSTDGRLKVIYNIEDMQYSLEKIISSLKKEIENLEKLFDIKIK